MTRAAFPSRSSAVGAMTLMCLTLSSCASAHVQAVTTQPPPTNPPYSLVVNADGDRIVKGDIKPGVQHDPGTTGAYMFPDGREIPPAEGKCFARWEWAHSRGGEDFETTYIEFTVAAETANVVVNSVEVSDQTKPPRKGKIADCPQGGPLGGHFLMIDLDTGKSQFYYSESAGQETLTEFGFKLKPGDAERVVVIARAKITSHEWRLKLGMIVAGTPLDRTIDNKGKPFVTLVAQPGTSSFYWSGDSWKVLGTK